MLISACKAYQQSVAVAAMFYRTFSATVQVRIIPQAIAEAEGEKVFRYYPAMPGNSTCLVQEKEQLQRGNMPDHFFLGSQDRTCPVTTISSLMEKHGICQLDLLKVQLLFFDPGKGCGGLDGVEGCMCAVSDSQSLVKRHNNCHASFCVGMNGLQQ